MVTSQSERIKPGPKPKPDKGTQTGFRISARQRLELNVAEAFIGAGSLQALLDKAVEFYLDDLKDNVDGFRDAVLNAEHNRRKIGGIRNLHER